MRIGLIGVGRIGAFHADTLSGLDAVDSLVVTDAVPAVTASVAERFGAEAAESPEALIKAGVDGIVIAAATDAHLALITAGVDAGIPVFCEKPLSGVVADAVAIADHVHSSGVPVQIHLSKSPFSKFTSGDAPVKLWKRNDGIATSKPDWPPSPIIVFFHSFW